MIRKLLVILGAVGIVALGVLILKAMGSGKAEEKEVKNFDITKYVYSEIIDYKDYSVNVEAYGTVTPKNKIQIFSEVPGKMTTTSKKFDVGINFNKGETLIKLDDREISLQILSAKSDLITAITNLLPDLKTDFKDSYNNWKNYLDDFDMHKNIKPIPDYNNSKEKYFLANRGILKLFYNIQNLELAKEKHTIKAPFNGTVTESLVDPGTMINMGQRLGTFSGLNDYEIELSVLQNDLAFVRIGQTLEVMSQASGEVWLGKISRIGDYIDPATQTVKVYADLYGSGLKDGMYLNAKIQGSQLNNVFKIPRKALYNNDYVYLIKDSLLDKHSVHILKLSDEFAYINGLDSNLTVITQALVSPELGMKVKPIKNN